MTDVDPLLERIDRDLVECDASTMPNLAAAIRVPREMVEANPVDLVAQLRAECAERVDRATGEPTPASLPPLTIGDVARVFDVPVELLDPQRPMPARRRPWWRRWWWSR